MSEVSEVRQHTQYMGMGAIWAWVQMVATPYMVILDVSEWCQMYQCDKDVWLIVTSYHKSDISKEYKIKASVENAACGRHPVAARSFLSCIYVYSK